MGTINSLHHDPKRDSWKHRDPFGSADPKPTGEAFMIFIGFGTRETHGNG